MGHVVPLHQPLRLAEEIAIVDQMLAGRFDIGLVSGVSPAPFGPFGADFQTRRDVTIEFIDFLKAAYADGKPFDFAGRYHRAKGVRLSVQPTQRPHPPIWLETRDPATLAVCAREGFNTGYFFVFRRDEVAPVYRIFLDQWKAAGWNRKPNIGYSTTVYVDETDEKAVKNGLWDASQAYRGFFAGVSDDKAELKKAQQAAGDRYAERGELGTADIMRHLLDPEYLLEKDLILVGSPDTVARKLEAYATEGVFNTFLGEFNFGALPEEHLMRSIRLFATEVMPRLRGFEPF
jgi:alkanesulfonate monooxygenase SsuD/methylene tetrahydromethanopterin reductase-like flavin-dependent oxidoreductase (luciferase family)